MRIRNCLFAVVLTTVYLLCACSSIVGEPEYTITLTQWVDYREEQQGKGPIKVVRFHTAKCNNEEWVKGYDDYSARWCDSIELSDELPFSPESSYTWSQQVSESLKDNQVIEPLINDLPDEVVIGRHTTTCFAPGYLVAEVCNAQLSSPSSRGTGMDVRLLREFFLIKNTLTGELTFVDSVNHAVSPRWHVLDGGAFDRLGRYFFYEKPSGAYRYSIDSKVTRQVTGVQQWLIAWNSDIISGYNKDAHEFNLLDTAFMSITRVPGQFEGSVVSSYMIDASTLLFLSRETGLTGPLYYLNVVEFQTGQYRRLCEVNSRGQILEARTGK